MIKILILADPNSPHTVKWVTSLAKTDFELCICGLTSAKHDLFDSFKNITDYSLDMKLSNKEVEKSKFSKLRYIKSIRQLRRVIKTCKPDILHAHYATSYGLLAVLMNFHPCVISVWGSDVYDFPKVSYLHKALFKFILNRADKLLSTSKVMAGETQKYTSRRIEVTPFGIDLNLFHRTEGKRLFNKDDFVIGTIKNLEKVYGIDVLIKAFKILKDKYSEKPLKLLIVGSGTYEPDLKNLVKSLNLGNDTVFTGRIENNITPIYYSMMNAAVFLSARESFGVSAIEAAACNVPVIVSEARGFTEVFENNVTGLIVKLDNAAEAAAAVEKILLNKELAVLLGEAGRRKVIDNYDWKNNFEKVLTIYKEISG